MTAFRRLSERELHRWRAFRLVEAAFEAPGGETFTRTVVRHPGAVGIVAVDAGDAILVRQFRPALGYDLLEIPAGTLDVEGEPPLSCGQRELAEEAGVTAGHWEHLVTYAVAPGISDEILHLYLATDLSFGDPAGQGFEEREMVVERFALADTAAAIADGRLTDAKTIAGLLLANLRL